MTSDERSQPVNPKWGALPDSLAEKGTKRRKCEFCGKMTTGTHGNTKIRIGLNGEILPPPKHLCAACDPDSGQARKQASYERERASESRRSGRSKS